MPSFRREDPPTGDEGVDGVCPAALGEVLGRVEDRLGQVAVRVLKGDELGQPRVQAEGQGHAALQALTAL